MNAKGRLMVAKRGDITLREYLNQIDITILEDLIVAAKTALNDTETIIKVSEETNIAEKRLYALLPVVIDLSAGHMPKIKSEKDVENQIKSTEKSDIAVQKNPSEK